MNNFKVNSKTSNLEFKRKHNQLVENAQQELVSGTNIKTINNQSLLGSGNIAINGGTQLYKHTFSISFNTYINGTSYYVSSKSLTLISTFSNTITKEFLTNNLDKIVSYINGGAVSTQPSSSVTQYIDFWTFYVTGSNLYMLYHAYNSTDKVIRDSVSFTIVGSDTVTTL